MENFPFHDTVLLIYINQYSFGWKLCKPSSICLELKGYFLPYLVEKNLTEKLGHQSIWAWNNITLPSVVLSLALPHHSFFILTILDMCQETEQLLSSGPTPKRFELLIRDTERNSMYNLESFGEEIKLVLRA